MPKKVTTEQRQAILQMLAKGEDRDTTAAAVGVTPGQVSAIAAHVKMMSVRPTAWVTGRKGGTAGGRIDAGGDASLEAGRRMWTGGVGGGGADRAGMSSQRRDPTARGRTIRR
jgi:hypothetical protein